MQLMCGKPCTDHSQLQLAQEAAGAPAKTEQKHTGLQKIPACPGARPGSEVFSSCSFKGNATG